MSTGPSNRSVFGRYGKPTELMKACGSKSGGWEPESPDHWRWLLANATGEERALAWIKLKSIAQGSPWCIDETGKTLRIDSMAADLGWALQSTKNVCTQLVDEGRIRTQDGKILYRANVPEAAEREINNLQPKILCTKYFPAYLIDFIEKLSADKRARVDAYIAWRPKFFAEGLAALRLIDERVQDTILLQAGCKKKKLPKRRAAEFKWVQLDLLSEPDFVQSMAAANGTQSIQSPNGASYKPVSDSVHVRASLLSSDLALASKKEAAANGSGAVQTGAAADLAPERLIQELITHCAELGLQLPDRGLCVKLLARFSKMPPQSWPKFAKQFSPGLWLKKTSEELAMEAFRQQHSPGKTSSETAPRDRVIARMKAANAGSGG